ncbi:MAG: hydrogenase maturation protease [Beijerinckiaceae bacterium]
MTRTSDQAHSPRKVLIAGLGNPDRGDDGVGMIVAHKLDGRLPDDVAILTRSDDMVSLIEDWAGFDALVCVDAAAPTGAPGRIHRIDLATDELPRDMSFASSHAFGLAVAIGLARMLERAPRDIVVYAIEGCCFDAGAALTPAVAAAAADAADRIAAEACRLRQGTSAMAPDA